MRRAVGPIVMYVVLAAIAYYVFGFIVGSDPKPTPPRWTTEQLAEYYAQQQAEEEKRQAEEPQMDREEAFKVVLDLARIHAVGDNQLEAIKVVDKYSDESCE